jgi:hypothetical protein
MYHQNITLARARARVADLQRAATHSTATVPPRVVLCVVIAAVGLGALIVPVAAPAAPGFHDRTDDTFVNPDFCGSGVAVQMRDVLVANGHETDTGVAVAFSQKLTFTYGELSIASRNVGREVIAIVEGGELVVRSGLQGQLKLPGGGLVRSDAGNLQFLLTFNEHGELVDLQIVKDAGHHEGFASGAFCSAALDLLGISAS